MITSADGGFTISPPVVAPRRFSSGTAPSPAGTVTVNNQASPIALLRRVLIAAITGALPDEYRDEAVNLLLEAMNTPDDEIRGLSVLALQEIGGAAPLILPVLAGALHDPSELVRRRAARAIGDLGLAGVQALPHLIAGLQDASESVRLEVMSALSRLESEAEPALPLLINQLCEPEIRLRTVASATIKRVGPVAINYLLCALVDNDAIMRERSAILLGQMGYFEDSIIEGLLEACGDSDPDVREAARLALDRLQPCLSVG